MSKVEKFWENATAFDVAQVMAGETVEARFRDLGTEPWTTPRALGGWSNQGWVSGLTWNHCQVYREPSWYADKPDPGPGWRLLGKLPDEDPQLGDSVFCPGSEIWLELEAPFEPGQRHGLWYRRRIEPNPTRCIGRFCSLAKSTGVFCPHDSCDIETGVRIANNPEIPDSCERQKLEAGKEYLLPSGMVLIVSSERI